jgi:peptide/nickel transport system substrate-binding protein
MVNLGGYYPTTPALDGNAPWIQSANPERGRAIREAMSLAIDRDTIMKKLLPGFSVPVGAPLLHWPDDPNLTDPAWTPPPYDLELAKKKLAEGGYPDGFDITLRAFEQLPTAEAIVDMWGELGLKVNFERTEQANMRPLFEQSNKPEGHSATNGTAWIWCNPRYPDPTMMFPNAWRTTGFRMQAFSPAIEEAYPKMIAEADPAKRYAIARSIGDALREDGHPIPLYGYKYGWVAGPRVGDYTPLPGVNDFGAAETVTKAQN